MLDWIDKAEKLAPDEPLSGIRGSCYELLVDQVKQSKKKEKHINNAIEQFESWIKESPQESRAYVELAEAVLKKNIILEKYKPKDFEKVLSLFCQSVELDVAALKSEKSYYLYYNNVAFTSFLYACYEIAILPFEQALKTHRHFLKEFKRLSTDYIKKDKFYFYIWAKTLGTVIDHNKTSHKNCIPLSKNIIIEIKKEIEDKLSHVTSLISEDKDKLSNLGHVFHEIAKDKKSFAYHKIAVNYFHKAQSIDPHTWCYPVYATNVLKDIALLYLEKDNVKDAQIAFKNGKKIFEEAEITVGEDFTLFSYYGKFLYTYAKYIGDFINKSLLEEARQKLLVAKRLGEKFYDSPYIYLAKVALKLGEKNKCIEILKECSHAFSNEYYNYDFKQIRKNKDFDELKNNIKFQRLTKVINEDSKQDM